jgi:hypothetical protein
VEKWDNFYAAEFITLKFEERAGGKELAALARQQRRHEDELVVVNALGAVVRLREMVLE